MSIKVSRADKIPSCEVVIPREVLKYSLKRCGRLRRSVFKNDIFIRFQRMQSRSLNRQHISLIRLNAAGMIAKE